MAIAAQNFTLVPKPELEITGAVDVRRDLERRDFQEALSELLVASGLSGKFTIIAQRTTKGTAHTKGLHIKAPNAAGPNLTWHVGSNDRCILFMIRTPSRLFRSAQEFHDKICKGESVLEIRRRVAPEPKPEKPVVVQTQETSEIATEEVVPTAVALVALQESTDPTTASIDDANAELIVAEVVKYANAQGILNRSHVLDTLTTLRYGGNLRGPAIRSLIASGHFRNAHRQDQLRIGDRWLQKYVPTAKVEPSDEPSASAVVVTIVAAAEASEHTLEEPKADLAQSTVKARAPLTIGQRVARLERLAREAAAKQKRINEINDERRSLEQIVATYAERIAVLDAERKGLQSDLEKPDYKDVDVRLKAITDQLG